MVPLSFSQKFFGLEFFGVDVQRALEVVKVGWDHWLQFTCEALGLGTGLLHDYTTLILKWHYLTLMLQIKRDLAAR